MTLNYSKPTELHSPFEAINEEVLLADCCDPIERFLTAATRFLAAMIAALIGTLIYVNLISPLPGEYGPGWSISPSHTPAGATFEHSALKGGEK